MSITRSREVGTELASIDSPRAKLVYLYLEKVGGATVEQIQSALDMQKISLFGILDTLDRQGLLDRDGDRYLAA